ncbi:MAG: pyrroline-5-carboxylate reductase dimerization domain-containing protein [Pontixanthobacter sp.]
MAFDRILIVGFGTMTGAMVDGWLRAGYAADRFEVYHPRRSQVANDLIVHNDWPTADGSDAPYDAVLLGVKPHLLDHVAEGLATLLSENTVLLTVLAGLPIDAYRSRFPEAGGIVRLMPNLASALGKSPNALFGSGLSPAQTSAVTKLAQDIGTAEWLDGEAQFDLVTALTGSGPGFVYRFIDALAAGASDLGLEREQATRLSVAMVEGAAALAASSPLDPDTLAAKVASPGGMTQKGLDVLDANEALNRLMRDCLEAARDRGTELARDSDAKR